MALEVDDVPNGKPTRKLQLRTLPANYEYLTEEQRIAACAVAQDIVKVALAGIDNKIKGLPEQKYWEVVSVTIDLAKMAFLETLDEVVRNATKNEKEQAGNDSDSVD
jgi:hypothetical protein